MRIGVLTGGGDCPGLNAAIRAVVRRGVKSHDLQVFGFRNGWHGVLSRDALELTQDNTGGLLHRGGTILGTSRLDVFAEPDGVLRLRESMHAFGLEGLIVIGGEGTLACAAKLSAEGIQLVGIPKTIDNDVWGTDYTIGFDSAVQIATATIDRLHNTAESHHRVMVLEVMGRQAGWIGLYSGLAGGADAILIPEHPFDISEVCQHLEHRYETGHMFSIVVVSEGAVPAEGTLPAPEYAKDAYGRPKLGGISTVVAQEIEMRIQVEARVTILGHVQRGGSPSAADRMLATRYGVAAIDMAARGEWSRMVAINGGELTSVSLADVLSTPKKVPSELYELAAVFFG